MMTSFLVMVYSFDGELVCRFSSLPVPEFNYKKNLFNQIQYQRL